MTIQGWFVFNISAALALSAPMMASAQNASPPTSRATPNREGNVYAHHKHQPHTRRPLAESTAQVDDEVKALLEQTDDLDRRFGGQ